ncbi:YggS family pyridoxal phosphate-dependent enzyme [Pectobacterium aroidearum]|uniref:YggS family pyridoxal phosphate-dependent enzyme n=1 Tax=Pectobacterium aroidearum TaxID=1201031 RepID=UPI003306E1A7
MKISRSIWRRCRPRIEAACRRVDRDPATVRLLPVSKTKPESRLRMAHMAGCRVLGENKVQEAYRKWESMQDLADLQWSVIGHLQTNKAKLVARFATEFQALDSLRLAEALDRRLQVEGRSLDVFVQVNTSGEASKYGLSPDDVPAFIQALPTFSALRVRGAHDAGAVLQRGRTRAPVFCTVASVARAIAAKSPDRHRSG